MYLDEPIYPFTSSFLWSSRSWNYFRISTFGSFHDLKFLECITLQKFSAESSEKEKNKKRKRLRLFPPEVLLSSSLASCGYELGWPAGKDAKRTGGQLVRSGNKLTLPGRLIVQGISIARFRILLPQISRGQSVGRFGEQVAKLQGNPKFFLPNFPHSCKSDLYSDPRKHQQRR